MPKVPEAHNAARRQQIIDAAYRCFAHKGLHQATMRDIYAEANLSPGAVYHYFDSKDAIIQASFEFDYQRSLGLFDAARVSDDPIQALHELFDFFFKGLEGAAALGAGRVNVQSWGEALVNPPLLSAIRRVIDDYLDALTQIIQSAQESGQIDESLEPRSVGRVVLSLYYGLELQKALDIDVEVDTYAAAIKTLLLSSPRRT
jgi:AcrR family transcriptional regulator